MMLDTGILHGRKRAVNLSWTRCLGLTRARAAIASGGRPRAVHREGRILTLPPTPSPPRSGGEGRGEEELRRNHWQAQIKSPSPRPSPRASLRGEGVNYGGSGKMRPTPTRAAAFNAILRYRPLCRRTRPVRRVREWSDTREDSSRRFPSP